jgi:LCP family protein required for cell wall assembly
VRRWLLIVLGTVVVLAGVLLGVAWWQANDVLAQLHAGPKQAVVNAVRPELHKAAARQLVKPPPEPKAQTILVIGSDHRWDGGAHNARSDTIILARIEPSRHRIALLSIPRDLYVEIPGHGHDRINEAFHLGGERLLTRVVRETFGVEIDHFVEVDFHGFKGLVSALGGVYLPVDQRYFNQNVGTAATNYANIDLQPGYQKLDGRQALAFARFRHTDNDLVRAARQQLLIRTAAHQALSGGWDPFRIRRLAYAFAKATTSDISSLGEVLSLAQAVRDTPPSSIARLTVQASDVVLYGADYLQASDAQLRATVRAWLGEAMPKRKTTPAHERRAIAAAAARQVQLAANTQGASLLASVHDGIRTCAPTRLPFGFWYPGGAARSYVLAGHPAIALYSTAGSGDSVLWMYTTWRDPPILADPTGAVTRGGRTYDVYTEAGKIRQVAWTLGATRVWITNTLEDSLTNAQMLALATSCR